MHFEIIAVNHSRYGGSEWFSPNEEKSHKTTQACTKGKHSIIWIKQIIFVV